MKETGNGKFYEMISKLCDMVMLGLIFVITSLPVITIGVSCTALYYAAAKTIRFEEGKPVKEYLRAWKRNFRQGGIAGVVYLILGLALFLTVQIAGLGLTAAAAVISGVILLGSALYYFPVLSRFTMTVKECFQVSLFLAIHHLGKTVLLLLVFGLCTVVFCINPFLVVFLLPGFALYETFFMEEVFKEYRNLSGEDRELWFARE